MGERREIVIGEGFEAGRVIRQIPSDRHGKRMVEVQCAHCPEIGRHRFNQLCDGVVKSCRCKKIAAYKRYMHNKLALISVETRRAIFDADLTGGAFQAAQSFGISKALVDFVRRSEQDELKRVSAHIREGVYAVAQKNVDEAMRQFTLTRSEVLFLCRVEHKRIVAAEEEAKAAKAEIEAKWNALTPDQRQEIENALGHADYHMGAAVRFATDEFYDDARYSGELTHEEFSSGNRKSYFRWIFDVTQLVPGSILAELFGEKANSFVSICLYTLDRRRTRRRTFLDNLKARLLKPSRTAKVIQFPLESQFPKPKMAIGAIANALTTFAPALAA